MPDYIAGENVRRIIEEETSKAPIGRVSVQGSGPIAVVNVHTVKPDTFNQRRGSDLVPALEKALKRTVTVDVTPESYAIAKFVRVPPLKARRVMDAIRGMYVDEALAILRFTPNRAARYIEKLVKSAAANAYEGWAAEPAELKISEIMAGGGPTMKRIQPRAQGRAYRILKRTSHLSVRLQAAEPRPTKTTRRRRRAQVTRADGARR